LNSSEDDFETVYEHEAATLKEMEAVEVKLGASGEHSLINFSIETLFWPFKILH
jgi:hypothetical protein